MPGRKRVHVAAAVIRNPQGRILIAKRADHQHQGGLWEFPGGKVEPEEPVEQALSRELEEELGIAVRQARPLIRIAHDYSDKSVLLDVWLVSGFAGEARGCEGQPIEWVVPSDLDRYPFPAANHPIIRAAQLPEQLLITGVESTSFQLEANITRALQGGQRLFMVRDPNGDQSRMADLYGRAVKLCEPLGANVVLNTSMEQAHQLGAQSLHLNSRRLMALDSRGQFKGRWLSASCHNAEELAQAARLGLDFVTLSPVLATASHPDANPLGWEKFNALVERCPLPVYALGGVGEAQLEQAWRTGAQGIAGISHWWS
ncbi:Nudix family hydrolase [Marinobacterium litorale]|uniref:Nudix family hydrolase n=1 Tax=Marinobacterium litorale TaxID=404770 RepID=UPI00041FCAF6|nr:Nudix family hydrolase [Marinobacterium litorale]